jgi:hypothetical protein
MSDSNTSSTRGTTPAAEAAPFDAQAARQQIALLIQSIPEFASPGRKPEKGIFRKGAFPNEYIETICAAVDKSTDLQAVTHFDVVRARAVLTRTTDLNGLLADAQVLEQGLRYTIARMRSEIVDACDLVYATAQGVVRADKSLSPHLGAIKHASRRKGGNKKPAVPADPAPKTE